MMLALITYSKGAPFYNAITTLNTVRSWDRKRKVLKCGMMQGSEQITAPISGQAFVWPISWMANYIVAVAGGMIIGFLPEALVSRIYYNTGLEPYSPMIIPIKTRAKRRREPVLRPVSNN
jgi:hypothetical protein